MKNKVFSYAKAQVMSYAEDFFIKSCGFDMSKPRHQKMMDEALSVLSAEKPEVEMKAVCSRLGKDAYSEGKVVVDDVEITCNGFSRISDEDVLDVYMCVVTAGDWYMKEATRARQQVYMDTWGTAFADGAKVLLEDQLKSALADDGFLSDPFGPGYYGMPSSDTHKFAEILDMSLIGVGVRDSGIMVPLKSIAAIYLVTNNESVLPPMACSECFGRVDGCRYCKNRDIVR